MNHISNCLADLFRGRRVDREETFGRNSKLFSQQSLRDAQISEQMFKLATLPLLPFVEVQRTDVAIHSGPFREKSGQFILDVLHLKSVHVLRMERDDEQSLTLTVDADGEAHPVSFAGEEVKGWNATVAKAALKFKRYEFHAI